MGNQKKIIGLIIIGGRVGSSMAMGLLQKSGINLGAISEVSDANNPNGYFEVPGMYHHIFDKLYPQLDGFMPYPVLNNDVEIHKNLTEENLIEFEDKMFTKWFKKNKNRSIAVKIPYLYPTELFSRIAKRNGFEYVEVSLMRSVIGAVSSIKKMNQSNRTEDQWLNWFTAWRSIKDAMNFHNKIYFENWFIRPYETYLDLYNMVQPPIKLTREKVIEYINPKYKHF